jgi:hypothetical protein
LISLTGTPPVTISPLLDFTPDGVWCVGEDIPWERGSDQWSALWFYYIISNMEDIDVRIVNTSSQFRVTSNLRKLDPGERW